MLKTQNKRIIKKEFIIPKELLYIVSLYCYIEDQIIIKKNKINFKKYDIEKWKGFFFIGLINNKNKLNEYLITLNNELKKINCEIDITKYNNILIKSISYTLIKNNNLRATNIYKFFIKYNTTLYKLDKEIVITSCLPSNNIIYKSHKNIEIILLIYHILGLNTGLFWGFIPDFTNYLEKKYNSLIECFASPFNHILKKYYSVLYLLDKNYGSLGDFFERFLEEEYLINIINPPWTAELIIKTLKYIELKLQKHKCAIYLYIPQWNDLVLPFYNKLKENNEIIIFKNDLPAKETYTYDYVNQKKIITTFNTTVFLIHNIKDDNTFEENYIYMLKSFFIAPQ